MRLGFNVLAVAVATACGVDNSPLDTGMCGFTDKIEQASYVDSPVRWYKKRASVCWINPSKKDEMYRYWVQDAVTHGWDKHIGLDFIWSDRACGGCEDIRIKISDEQPYAIFGTWRYLNGNFLATIVFNFKYKKFDKVCDNDEPTREMCIRKMAAHEFGHSLGFIHEQNRPDTPEWCLSSVEENEMDGSHGDVMSPVWDKDSIMNACGNATEPSPLDIETAIGLYGAEQ